MAFDASKLKNAGLLNVDTAELAELTSPPRKKLTSYCTSKRCGRYIVDGRNKYRRRTEKPDCVGAWFCPDCEHALVTEEVVSQKEAA